MIRNDSGRTRKRAKRPGAKQQKNGKVGIAEANEKIGETARISRFHDKSNNISPSEWYRGHKETNTAKNIGK